MNKGYPHLYLGKSNFSANLIFMYESCEYAHIQNNLASKIKQAISGILSLTEASCKNQTTVY